MKISVENTPDHDMCIKGRAVLGRIHQVRSVTPVDVVRKDLPSSGDAPTSEPNLSDSAKPDSSSKANGGGNIKSALHLPIGQGLTGEQQAIVLDMLHDEAKSFLQDDNDIGCAERLQMSFNTHFRDYLFYAPSFTVYQTTIP